MPQQPEIGQKAPDFTLETDRDGPFTLSAQHGRPVVLFFYPEDDTPGCTRQNCEFSDLQPGFAEHGALVVGISPNSTADHARFRKKYGLKAILASDPDHQAIAPYGVWGPKKLAGHEYVGLIRTTFLIDENGNIAEKWTVARTKGHAQKVLDALVTLTR